MKLTCVIDNTANFSSEFYAEHVLSILIDYDNNKILFDTGKSSEILKHNINLFNGFNNIKKVVVSHGHSDHTGGLSYIQENSSADIFIHENAFLPKYISKNGRLEFIGTQDIDKSYMKIIPNTVNSTKLTENLIYKPLKIAPNIYIFGNIELKYDFEEMNPFFLVKEDGKLINDNFDDEIVLVINSDKGLVIFSGCAHRGIINTLSSVVKYFKEKVYAVIGGTHLINAHDNRLNKTMNELKKFDPENLIFGHCNGLNAQCILKSQFNDKFQVLKSVEEFI